MKNLSLILTIALVNALSLHAQFKNTKYTQISQRDGLPDNVVTCIFQDSKGFMWFGTRSRGLSRFDGVSFKIYNYNSRDTNSISSNFVYRIHEDASGNLWMTTQNGLDKFDRTKESFKHFEHVPLLSKESDNWIIGITPGKSDKLWLGTWSGEILQLDPKTETLSKVFPVSGEQDSKFNAQIVSLHEDTNGLLWVGTLNSGLYVMDPSGDFKIVHHYQHDSDKDQSLSNNRVFSIFEDSHGAHWAGTMNGLNKLVPAGDTGQQMIIEHFYHKPDDPFSISHNEVYGMQEDEAGLLWIATTNGINTFNRKTGRFNVWPYDDVMVNSFERFFSLNSLIIDNVGSVWYSVFYEGASMLSFHRNKFEFLQPDSIKENGLPQDGISNILLDTSGVQWLGTWGEGLTERIPGEDGQETTWYIYSHNPKDPTSLSGNDVRTVFLDSKGVLWVGTENSGLNKVAGTRKGKAFFKHYIPDSLHVESTHRLDIIHEDKNGNFWIGGEFLYLFDRQTEKFFRFVADTAKKDSLSFWWINSIAEDSSGNIWLGTWGESLFKISPPFTQMGSYITGKIQSYKYHIDLPNDLGDWQIRDILVPRLYTENLILIATNGGGLFCLREAKDKSGHYNEYFTNYTVNDGLSSFNIQGIEEDSNGEIWLSTSEGLSRFNPASELFINYYTGDGLSNNEFGWLAHYKGPDGKLYYGLDGLFSFYPDSVFSNKSVPLVYITGIDLYNDPLNVGYNSPLETSLSEAKEITLSHDQNYITLKFAALNFIDRKENRYKYKLEGFDDEWVEAGTENQAIYQGLQPGKYTFRVIGSNNDGIWNTQGASLKIRIRPPWWRSISAFISYFFLLLIGVYAFVKFRERKIQKDKKVLEEKIFERTEELHEVNTQLEEHHEELVQQKEELQQTLDYLKETQAQLVQSEKLASIGQLTAGIAHEINNPVNYISAGIDSLRTNVKEIGNILDLYRSITEENVAEKLEIIRTEEEKIDIDETRNEIRNLIKSVIKGTERTTEIVKGLRTFSRLDENEIKPADIHEGIDLTLVMLHNKYKHHVEIIKQYGNLPMVECFPGKLNQVFMNILSNGIEAITEKGTITIKTWEDKSNEKVCISIKDNGTGMTETTKSNLFNPFFTTKEVGKGTGLGLSISHGIIEQHKGTIKVKSEPGTGSEFIITLPIKHN